MKSAKAPKWDLFQGNGRPHRSDPKVAAWKEIPPLRSWRLRAPGEAPVFDMPEGLADAVNAALHLRRPLLLTGGPGSGKSTLVDLIAAELELGAALNWHITSKSTLTDGLYEYDALGRLHVTQEPDVPPEAAAAENFVLLGPLGTALAAEQVRAVLIDEIDKSDLDLPGDLLNVMERGEFPIPVLARAKSQRRFRVKGADGGEYQVDEDGVVRRNRDNEFPVIVFTSNGERAFSAPFLRRCVRFDMPPVGPERLVRIVAAHLDKAAAEVERHQIEEFAGRLRDNPLAINQILEYVALVTGKSAPDSDAREGLRKILLRELSG
jgi:MoxR-like ATPase